MPRLSVLHASAIAVAISLDLSMFATRHRYGEDTLQGRGAGTIVVVSSLRARVFAAVRSCCVAIIVRNHAHNVMNRASYNRPTAVNFFGETVAVRWCGLYTEHAIQY